jgi:hypothetical protein
VQAACKGTGTAYFSTKAKGSALWMSGANQHLINDPSDGGSYRFSAASGLNCGNPPPPPSKDDVCNTTNSPRSSRSTMAGTPRLPIC